MTMVTVWFYLEIPLGIVFEIFLLLEIEASVIHEDQ